MTPSSHQDEAPVRKSVNVTDFTQGFHRLNEPPHCEKCARYAAQHRRMIWECVAPNGIAHIAADTHETLCGLTTSGSWWWAL